MGWMKSRVTARAKTRARSKEEAQGQESVRGSKGGDSEQNVKKRSGPARSIQAGTASPSRKPSASKAFGWGGWGKNRARAEG